MIGTSGWSYDHWIGPLYPEKLKSYDDLKFFSERFDTVENNSSFYRIASRATYQKWFRVTKEGFVFSLKLNKTFTHVHRLVLDDALLSQLKEHFSNVQVLQNKLGCLLIQTPPSLKYDLKVLDIFLSQITGLTDALAYKPDLAIEFRNKYWFTKDLYALLRKYNVALTVAQSSRYPSERQITANFLYVRFHGPRELFASRYSEDEMDEWWRYITSARNVKKVYIYFNNDFHGYAIENARYLQSLQEKAKRKHSQK